MNLPENHTERLERARLSLEGLAIGDAFGEMLAYNCASARQRVERGLMGGPWFHTDDTEMALAIYEVLRRFGRIDADELALRFAERFGKIRTAVTATGGIVALYAGRQSIPADWQEARERFDIDGGE